MNLDLVMDHQVPDSVEERLECQNLPVVCAFNRWGTMLAVGRNDGYIEVWDFVTRSRVRTIMAHVGPVCSLSWSRTGHRLLSATRSGGFATVWNVDTLRSEFRTGYLAGAPIRVQFHPRDDSRFLLISAFEWPFIVKTDRTSSRVPKPEQKPEVRSGSFDRRGLHVYTGNTRGLVAVFETDSLALRASFRVHASAASSSAVVGVRGMEFSRRGDCLLLNCSDRVVRIYDCDRILAAGIDERPLEPVLRLQNAVNNLSWNRCGFSGDGEYVIAGAPQDRSTSIWRRADGYLVRMLRETGGMNLLDAAWHPLKPIVVTVSAGDVTVWSRLTTENWSAFNPNFTELEKNEEYEERESEFDLEDEDEEATTGCKGGVGEVRSEVRDTHEEEEGEEEEQIDVVGCGRASDLLSSDEEDTEDRLLLYLVASYRDLKMEEDDEEEEDEEEKEEERRNVRANSRIEIGRHERATRRPKKA